MSNDEDKQEDIPTEDNQPHEDTKMVSLNYTERIATLVQHGGTIALASSLRCTVFRVRRTLQGQRVMVMLNSRTTLNFIISSLVKRRGLPTKTHAGLKVKVAKGTLLPCTNLVPQLSITMANHTVTKDFFIVDLDDMEVILGIHWIETLDEYTQSFKWMDFTFVVNAKKVVLHRIANEHPKEVSAHRMETIF